MIPFTYAEASREFEFPQPEEYWPVIELYLCGQNNAAWIAGACRPLAGIHRHEVLPPGYTRVTFGAGAILGPYAVGTICAGRRLLTHTVTQQHSLKPAESSADASNMASPYYDADMANVMAGLHTVVSAIQENRSLPSSPELDALMDQVIQSQRMPEDIREWAQSLAGDVGDLTD